MSNCPGFWLNHNSNMPGYQWGCSLVLLHVWAGHFLLLFLKETDFVLADILCLLFAFPGKNKMSGETFSWEVRKRKSTRLSIGYLYPPSKKHYMIMLLSQSPQRPQGCAALPRGCRSGTRLFGRCSVWLWRWQWVASGLGAMPPHAPGEQPPWVCRHLRWRGRGAGRSLAALWPEVACGESDFFPSPCASQVLALLLIQGDGSAR